MARRKKSSRRASEPATLKIPRELYENIGQHITGTGFRSPTEFAVHVLRDVCSTSKVEKPLPALSQEEIEAVRTRLRALGYID